MAFMFEKLEVNQKSVTLADTVASLSENFPRGYYFRVDQVNRAALSVAPKIAEGNGRITKPDRKHFFVIARGAAPECVSLLEVARRGFISDEQHRAMLEELETIAKMISGLINGLTKRDTGRTHVLTARLVHADQGRRVPFPWTPSTLFYVPGGIDSQRSNRHQRDKQ